MNKTYFIYTILKRRLGNVALLSVMFASLVLILMVGQGISGIFFNYMKSDYGNIPDLKVELSSLDQNQMNNILNEIEPLKNSIDYLYGYEKNFDLSIFNYDDFLLTSQLPVFIKGIKFEKTLPIKVDGNIKKVKIDSIRYDDNLKMVLDIGNYQVKDLNSIYFFNGEKSIDYGFCTNITQDNTKIYLKSIDCKDDADKLIDNLLKDEAQTISATLSSKEFTLDILEIDEYDKFIIADIGDYKEQFKLLSLTYKDQTIYDNLIESFDIYENELSIYFKVDRNKEKNYKRFLSKVTKAFINYQRIVLKLDLYAFSENEGEAVQDKEMVYLNELTDFIDLIFMNNDVNTLIASEYFASDLNNLGVLEDFKISLSKKKTKDDEEDEFESFDEEEKEPFVASIRSTIFYKPENIFNKNFIMINYELLKKEFNIPNKYNFIDIYIKDDQDIVISKIKNIIQKIDSKVKFLEQDDIIPSITPKKMIFKSVTWFILGFTVIILFVSMFIVLKQFYSNYRDELSLFKLFGSTYPFQTLINLISWLLSAVLMYFIMIYQEAIINSIMLKYFFIDYEIKVSHYSNSLIVLGVLIVLVFILERREMKKLNIIKGQ